MKCTCCKSEDIVDIIYDNFESRSCDSCLYLDRDTGKSYSVCEYLNSNISAGMIDTFYCSEWEKKQ